MWMNNLPRTPEWAKNDQISKLPELPREDYDLQATRYALLENLTNNNRFVVRDIIEDHRQYKVRKQPR